MKQPNINPKFSAVLIMILIGAAFRFIPHWPNFTPIAAIALFGGTFFKPKSLAFIIPIVILLLSDLILGFHTNMIAVYISFIIIVCIGLLLRKNLKPANLLISSLSGSVIFFIITNFASWASGLMPYTKDFAGLIQAYIAGLPFFANTVLGDLTFNAVLFGGLYFLVHKLNFSTKTID